MFSYSFTGLYNERCTYFSLKCVHCLKQNEMVKYFPLLKNQRVFLSFLYCSAILNYESFKGLDFFKFHLQMLGVTVTYNNLTCISARILTFSHMSLGKGP